MAYVYHVTSRWRPLPDQVLKDLSDYSSNPSNINISSYQVRDPVPELIGAESEPLPESFLGLVEVRSDHYQAEYFLRGHPGRDGHWEIEAMPSKWDHIEGSANAGELGELTSAVLKAHRLLCALQPIDPRILPGENL